jgi:radical SAM superfamily enzyme YgiQ (UPF0313 family)
MSGVLVVDALSSGTGRRQSSRDSIGCGPRSVAGVFEKHGIRCRIKRAEDLVLQKASLRQFRHLAISAMTMDIPVVRGLISSWRRIESHGRVLLGGPIASDPQRVLEGLKPDVLVIGEGERTLEELITKGYLDGDTNLSVVRGVGYSESGTCFITEPRPLLSVQEISDDCKPSTTRVVDYPAYQASKVYVEVLRGCSNFRRTVIKLPDGRQCSDCGNCDSDDYAKRTNCPEEIPAGCGFCSVPATWGFPRSRSVESIVRETTDLLDMGVRRIVLEAPDFLDYKRGKNLTDPCNPPANLEAISELLDSLAGIPQIADGAAYLGIENMKACLLTDPAAETISRRLKGISPDIGLETGSAEHLRRIGKCGTPEDAVRAVRVARLHGMHPFVYLIYGLPGETDETVRESIRLMQEISHEGAERIILYGFRPLPGSAFEHFPSSSVNSELGRKMRKAADTINRTKKAEYIGRIIQGVAAEPSWAKHGHTMVYPLENGPVISVEGGYSPGTLVKVRITGVLSPGLVTGEIVHQD